MGEYATQIAAGQSVKIGTCEEMYYLRADQVREVIPEPGSVDPIRDAAQVRFRFPFPDEDRIQPGHFDDYGRRMPIRGLTPPTGEGWDHSIVQFTADGYNVCLPCPESGDSSHGLTVHRNGFNGSVFLSQQVWHEGLLVPVLECRCGMKWRLRTEDDAAPLLAALQAMHDDYAGRCDPQPERSDYLEIAERIRQGYEPGFAQSLGFLAAGA